MKFKKKKLLFAITVLTLPIIAVSCGAKDNTNENNQNNNENKTNETKVNQGSKLKSDEKKEKKEKVSVSSPKTDSDLNKKNETLTPKENSSETSEKKENSNSDKEVEKKPKETTKPTNSEKEKTVEEPKTTPKQSDEPKETAQPVEKPKENPVPTDNLEESEETGSGVQGSGDDAFYDSDTLDFINNLNFHVDKSETKTVDSVTVPEVNIRGYNKTKFEITILKLSVNTSINTILNIQYKVTLISDPKQERVRSISIDGFKSPKENWPVATKEQKIQNYQKALEIAERGKLWIPHWRPKKEDFVLVDSSVVFEAIDRSNDKTFNFSLSNKYKVSIASDPITTKSVAFLIGLTYEKNNLYFLTDRSIPTSDFEIWSTSPTNPGENIPNSVYLQLNTSNRTATIKYKLYNPNASKETEKLSKEFTEIVKY